MAIMQIRARDIGLAVLAATLFFVASAGAIVAFGELGLALATSVLLAVLLMSGAEGFRRMRRELRRTQVSVQRSYRQTEALHSLYASLSIEKPVPPMRSWAASPDFLNLIIHLLVKYRPLKIVEFGSGVSTLMIAHAVRAVRNHECRFISFEHDHEHWMKTMDYISNHELENYACLIHSALVTYSLLGKTWKWYDLSSMSELKDVDFVIVDGPPWHIQPLARYPALPLLYDKLSDHAIIVLDDAYRTEEREILEKWRSEFPELTVEIFPLEKGAAVCSKRGAQASMHHSLGERPRGK